MNLVSESLEQLYDRGNVSPYLYVELLNEGIQFKNPRDAINKAVDILPNLAKNAKTNLLALLFILYIGGMKKHVDKEDIKNNKVIVNMANEPDLTYDEIIDGFGLINNVLVDPATLSVSDYGKKFIKKHEGLHLRAYKDNYMITIGYGHAEYLKDAKYKVGDRISKEKAEVLFEKDIKKKADAIKRMFKQWNDQGISIKISQDMFDSMVSMAYNMGIGGFRKSNVVKELKDGNYKEAANSILTTRVSNKFPGLAKRRAAEKALFLKNLF